MPQEKTGSNALLIVGILAAVILGGVFMVGILAALAIPAFTRYLIRAKEAEGRQVVAQIAEDVAACANHERVATTMDPAGLRSLPVTTNPVPATLAAVRGKKYQSAPGEWATPGWDCIHFALSEPQYFQYQWERTSTTEGVVRGAADLNGDGAPDVTFELPVTCTTSPTLTCRVGAMRELR